MLQQTQVDRVVQKYEEFIACFPDFNSLAKAPLRNILQAWQGMGYNRRALYLKKTAEEVAGKFNGRMPGTVEALTGLPGIGRNTACSIAAFAFNKPVVFIETNIRSVFIHFFFSDRTDVHDREILPLVEKVLDAENPRQWYSALMDYGVMLKKTHPNPSRKSAHHQKQSKFEGSNRQVRGMIIRILTETPHITKTALIKRLPAHGQKAKNTLQQLCKEGLVKISNGKLSID